MALLYIIRKEQFINLGKNAFEAFVIRGNCYALVVDDLVRMLSTSEVAIPDLLQRN